MTAAPPRLAGRAALLRQGFDAAFAAPPTGPAADDIDLLAIAVGGQPYAMRLAGIAGLFSGRRITRMPSRAPALLGLAGFRGAILPVYGLDLLLGHAAAAPRWLATLAAAPVAIAFEGFEGHLRLGRDAILREEGDAPARRLLPERALTGARPRPVVDLPALLDAIGRFAENAASRER